MITLDAPKPAAPKPAENKPGVVRHLYQDHQRTLAGLPARLEPVEPELPVPELAQQPKAEASTGDKPRRRKVE